MYRAKNMAQGVTHFVTGLLIGSAAYAFFGGDPFSLLLAAALGAIMADFDIATSLIGRYVKPIPALFKHRGITHSLIFAAFATIIFELVLRAVDFDGTIYPLVFFIGYLSHLALDSLNKRGTPLFYPAKLRAHGKMKYMGVKEWLLVIAMLTVLVWYWLF